MDSDTEKHIDALYRNCKQMGLLIVLGIFVPFVLVFAGPLGLLYACQRSNLLRRIDGGEVEISVSTTGQGTLSNSEKIAYLRRNGWNLLVPAFILAAYLVLIVAIVLFRK